MDERPILTSLSNTLVKRVRALKTRKGRTASDSFLVEGLHHIGSALEAGWEMDILLYAPDLLHGNYAESLLDEARRTGMSLQPVSSKVMESLAEKDNPQGILAVARQRRWDFSELPEIRSSIALVSPQDPGNVGTILRTLDAVIADALFILEGGVELYHPTCVRASMGAIFWKPVLQAGFDDFVNWAKERGIRLVGTSAHAQVDYREASLGEHPWILVLGSEQTGLSHRQVTACDMTVSLPMRGRVSSLNLAVAAGILLYALNT
jgi:TrmH family RNA methyltransferase